MILINENDTHDYVATLGYSACAQRSITIPSLYASPPHRRYVVFELVESDLIRVRNDWIIRSVLDVLVICILDI